jgi:hypothetical protein
MAEPLPVMTPVVVEVMRCLSNVTSLAQHDSMLDDMAATIPGAPPHLTEKKRMFRSMVATTMKRTGCPEEEAVKATAQYIYGRMIAVIPSDGETQHG